MSEPIFDRQRREAGLPPARRGPSETWAICLTGVEMLHLKVLAEIRISDEMAKPEADRCKAALEWDRSIARKIEAVMRNPLDPAS